MLDRSLAEEEFLCPNSSLEWGWLHLVALLIGRYGGGTLDSGMAQLPVSMTVGIGGSGHELDDFGVYP